MHKLGSGKYLYYFEVAGRRPRLFVRVLIYADDDEDVEACIQKEFGTRLKLKNSICQKLILLDCMMKQNYMNFDGG